MSQSLTQIAGAIRAGSQSAEETTRTALSRLDALNPRLNAFLDTFHARAILAARRIDERVKRGEPVGPLAGVPVALKDNICTGPDLFAGDADGARETAGGRTTCGSRFLEAYHSPYSATAARRLADAGAIVIGKTNLDEFAMGSSGENSAFGATRNPWDLTRVPGGSSSGSAAAVAAGVVPAALGSDTGGSIRQPASLCGIVGLKPTYGRVSRYGLVAFASSLDQIGPLTRSVGDAAAVLTALAGRDAHDSTSADLAHEDFGRDLERPIEGLVLGVPRQARSSANHPSVASALENAVRVYESLGARTIEVDLAHTDYGIAAYYIVATAEASSNLARFDGVRYGRRAKLGPDEGLMELYCRSRAEGFGAEVQRRIVLGTYVLSAGYYDAYYATALKARRKIKQDYDAAFAGDGAGGTRCDALLLPTAPTPAFALGSKTSDPLQMYLEDVYTVGVNLAGLPAISIPAGFASVGGSDLPVGVQLIGPAWQESRLLRIARMFERATDFSSRRPPTTV